MHRILRYALGLGSIGYAVLSLAQPKRLAELTKTEENDVYEWAIRDLGCGLDILIADDPGPALLNRALYDFSDGTTLLRTRRSLAPVAFLFALLAVIAVLTRPPAPDGD